MNNRTLVLLLAVFLTVGCGQKKAERFTALPFPDITLPALIQTQQDAAEYYAVHFWDLMTDPQRSFPSDSLLVSGVSRDDVEQKFANWLSVLDMVGLNVSEKAVKTLYDKALSCEKRDTSSNVFETFAELAERYMYDPIHPTKEGYAEWWMPKMESEMQRIIKTAEITGELIKYFRAEKMYEEEQD